MTTNQLYLIYDLLSVLEINVHPDSLKDATTLKEIEESLIVADAFAPVIRNESRAAQILGYYHDVYTAFYDKRPGMDTLSIFDRASTVLGIVLYAKFSDAVIQNIIQLILNSEEQNA